MDERPLQKHSELSKKPIKCLKVWRLLNVLPDRHVGVIPTQGVYWLSDIASLMLCTDTDSILTHIIAIQYYCTCIHTCQHPLSHEVPLHVQVQPPIPKIQYISEIYSNRIIGDHPWSDLESV